MANLVLLSDLETAEAAAQGWSLGHVYDLDTAKWQVRVLGSPSADLALNAVISLAKAGSKTAQKALSIVMKSNQGSK